MRHQLLPLIGSALLLTACGTRLSSTTPYWDQTFGTRARATLAMQIAHPQVPSHDPAAGMDGKQAQAAYERYQKPGNGAVAAAPAGMLQGAGTNK